MLKKRMWKNVLWLILTAVMLGGCGNTAEPKQSQENIDVTENGDRQQITLGCIPSIMPQLLDAAIADFNKSNPYYEVIVREYDWQAGQQRLEADLATGRGPDIFDLSMVYVDALVQKGMIEDLSPYLEDGQGLEREDLVESVLVCNTKEQVLTCVPPGFTLEIMLGKKSLIGERTGWTMEEFLECVENNEGMQVANSTYKWYKSELQNRYSIVHTAIYRNIGHFVDTENNKAEFDREEFAELLTFAKNYEAKPFDYEKQYNYEELVQEEELLLSQNGIRSVRDYMLAKAALGQEAQFIGFPADDGSPDCGIRNFISYGINADSQAKEGAWAFLEFLVTYKLAGAELDMYGFHTSEELLAEQFAEGMEKAYTLNADGERIEAAKWNSGRTEAYAAAEEDIETLRALIDGADYVYGLDSNSIYQIVQEEVYNYLGEEQNAEEAVNLIQNRVQLYLDEMN